MYSGAGVPGNQVSLGVPKVPPLDKVVTPGYRSLTVQVDVPSERGKCQSNAME